jgi:hypothetical protein
MGLKVYWKLPSLRNGFSHVSLPKHDNAWVRMSTTREKLKDEIALLLERQNVTKDNDKALFILRYLDEDGQFIEEPEWIELGGWEPTSLEWPAPPKHNGRSMTWLELINELSRQAVLHGIDSVMKVVHIEKASVKRALRKA